MKWEEVEEILKQIDKIDPLDKEGRHSLVHRCAALGGEPEFERGKVSCTFKEHEPLETYTGLFLSASSQLTENEAVGVLDFHGLDKSDFSKCFMPGRENAKDVLQGIAGCDPCFTYILSEDRRAAWKAFVKEKEKL